MRRVSAAACGLAFVLSASILLAAPPAKPPARGGAVPGQPPAGGPANVEFQRAAAQRRMNVDRMKFSREQRQRLETLYQVANKNWKTPEAIASLKQVLREFPQSNRAGCACVYLGQASRGDEAIGYYRTAIQKYGDCYWGDGAQVGPAARWLLALNLREAGQNDEAARLEAEIRTQFPNAIWHDGKPLVDKLPPQ